jgi:hypothetical protein
MRIYRLSIALVFCAGLAIGCGEEKATTAAQGKTGVGVAGAKKGPKDKEMPDAPPPPPPGPSKK